MLSYTVDQLWSDKDRYARAEWFAVNGEELAQKRGAAIEALRELAACIKRTGAHDAIKFDANDYTNNCVDTFDASLAPEVRDWFGS